MGDLSNKEIRVTDPCHSNFLSICTFPLCNGERKVENTMGKPKEITVAPALIPNNFNRKKPHKVTTNLSYYKNVTNS